MSSPPTPNANRPGAVGINIKWQAGLAPRPLVQEQGEGGDTLLTETGYRPGTSHTPNVDNAWVQIDWMDAYLLGTGEFPGNGNGTVGNNFFDMMNAMASFTRGTRAIHETAVWNALYAGKVTSETAKYDQICQWLLSSPTKAQGDTYNAPDTHRYYMSATVLRNTAYLLRLRDGTNAHADTYDAAALDYENQALARQKGAGWKLSLYPPFANGTARVSRLYLPPNAAPLYYDGTPSSSQIYGEGVRPEQGDPATEQTWDAIYNPNGDKLAVWGIAVQPANTSQSLAHREACSRAVDVNLFCAMQFLTAARDANGAPILIDPNGSSRVGSLDISDIPKKVDPNAWRDIFRVQAGLAPDAAVYGGSSDPNARAVFALVFNWLDAGIRNPSATLPAPPACPASLYPTLTAVAGSVTKTLTVTGPGGTVTRQITVTQS